MLLLEIAAQGVKGVSPAGGSARLRPGYNVVAVDGAVLFRLLDALFHPARPEGDAFRAAAAAHGTVRAGVTVVGNDGLTYRILRDFAAGCQLHRFDPKKRAFALVGQEIGFIAEQLETVVGVPTRERLRMLTVSAADLPSRSALVSASAPLLGPARRSLTPDEAQKRLAELRDELERSRRAEKLQYQLDGLQGRLFKLEEVLTEGARLREAAAAAEAASAALGPAVATAEQLGDVDEQLEAHARASAKRDEALAKIAAEREELDAVGAQGPPLPFWKAPRFWIGVGAGSLAALAAVAGSAVVQGLRYLALLDIPAFGWAAWVALGWVSAVEASGRVERRGKLVGEHERKVLGTFERETQAVRDLAKALGVPGVPGIKEALGKLAAARAAAGEARERVQAFDARPETRTAQEEKAQVEAELREVEAALAAQAGGFVRDPRSVEMEMKRVEEEAAQEDEAAAPLAPPAGDSLQELLERAAHELGGSSSAVVRSLQARASQLLQAFSGDRLTGLAVDDRGNLAAQAAGRSSLVGSLSPADRDLVFLAVKLSLVERALTEWKLVALADDAFAGLPEGARRRAARMLKQVARPGQLVHATADVAFRESADHVA